MCGSQRLRECARFFCHARGAGSGRRRPGGTGLPNFARSRIRGQRTLRRAVDDHPQGKGLGFDVVIVPGLERATRGPKHNRCFAGWSRPGWLGRRSRRSTSSSWLPSAATASRAASIAWIGKQQGASGKTMRPSACCMWRPRVPARSCTCWGPPRMKKDGRGSKPRLQRKPAGNCVDGAARRTFERARGRNASPRQAAPSSSKPSLPFHPCISSIQLRRLPADWKPPEHAAAAETDPGENQETHRAAPRLAGGARLRHRCACAAGRSDTAAGHRRGGVSQAVLAEVGGWRPRALAMLRSAGLPRAEAEPQSAEVVRALQARTPGCNRTVDSGRARRCTD